MGSKSSGRSQLINAQYWDQIAHEMKYDQAFDDILAEHYRISHLDLVRRWADVGESRLILKTDLFAEGLCPSRSFFWDILKQNHRVVGMDISNQIVTKAKSNALQYSPDSPGQYTSCDVKQLPFADNSFDLIISDSTLDHFHHKTEINTALSELSRILKPGGILIITLDNISNLTEPLFRLWIALGLSSFYIGSTYNIRELNHALEMAGLIVTDNTAFVHNPRFFAKAIISFLRKIHHSAFDRWIRKGLAFFDSFEKRKTKYLTAQFIAAKATKPRM